MDRQTHSATRTLNDEDENHGYGINHHAHQEPKETPGKNRWLFSALGDPGNSFSRHFVSYPRPLRPCLKTPPPGPPIFANMVSTSCCAHRFRHTSPSAFGGMRMYRFLVHLSSPARSRRQFKLPVLDSRFHRKQIVMPWHHIRICFHDAQIRHHRRQMSTHHGRQMSVKIMRCDIQFVSVSHGSDLERFAETIPRYIYDRDIHRRVFEVRPVIASAKQALARCHRYRRVVSNIGKRFRIAAVDFHPHQIERLHGMCNRQKTFRLEVPVEVDSDFHIIARTFAKRR